MVNNKAPSVEPQPTGMSMLEDHPYSNTTVNLAGGFASQMLGEREEIISASFISRDQNNVESEMIKEDD